jgi:hypothetical protein
MCEGLRRSLMCASNDESIWILRKVRKHLDHFNLTPQKRILSDITSLINNVPKL